MADPTHPTNWVGWGPVLSAISVTFDGTILAYFIAFCVALPIYLLYRRDGKVTATGVLLIFSLSGVVASQVVHLLEHFRQPGLREFANSWLSPLIGCLCGLVAGLFFWILRNRRISGAARYLLYPLPILVLIVGGFTLARVAHIWTPH